MNASEDRLTYMEAVMRCEEATRCAKLLQGQLDAAPTTVRPPRMLGAIWAIRTLNREAVIYRDHANQLALQGR